MAPDPVVVEPGICETISPRGAAVMSFSVVGKWGKNLAIRVPVAIARRIGLSDGETVEVNVQDGDLVVRRRAIDGRRRQEAEAAAAEIVADSRRYSLGGLSIRELLDEGRRG
jgi:antitoxin MazE